MGGPPLGQRNKILTQILGCEGWRVVEVFCEAPDGTRVWPVVTYLPPPEVRVVFRVERRWRPRCGKCGALCTKQHCEEERRRWNDLPWAGHPVCIEYMPIRVRCEGCHGT